MSKNPRHLADQSATTRIREHAAETIHRLHGTIPDGTGTHRADDTEAAA